MLKSYKINTQKMNGSWILRKWNSAILHYKFLCPNMSYSNPWNQYIIGSTVKILVDQQTIASLLGVPYNFIHTNLIWFFHTGVPLSWNGPRPLRLNGIQKLEAFYFRIKKTPGQSVQGCRRYWGSKQHLQNQVFSSNFD